MIVSRQSKQKIYHRDYCPYVKLMSKKYRKDWPMDLIRSRGYKECSWCGGIHGLYISLTNGTRVWNDPKQINSMKVSWDSKDKGVCFRTDLSFWKVLWSEADNGYKLWHINSICFDPNLTDKQLMRKTFHRQADVDPTKSIGKIIKYIYSHEQAKKIIKEDWHKLPKQSHAQKNYYKKMKKKERKKAIRRVDAIFKELERERIMKNG